jgi:predicted transcriptional regulator
MSIARADVISIRVASDLKNKIDSLAQATTRRRSDLIISWITERIEQEEWQLQKVEQGLEDLANENYATDEDLNALTQKWGLVVNR